MIHLTEQPIDYEALTETVRDNSAGAVVLFLGTVREVTGDALTDAIEYEAYVEMARVSMEQLEQQVRQRFPVKGVAIAHRIGSLLPGDISVAIAVSSPHRAEAFDAGRWLIDTLKEHVPIWKREHYRDGRVEWQHPGLAVSSTTASSEAQP